MLLRRVDKPIELEGQVLKMSAVEHESCLQRETLERGLELLIVSTVLEVCLEGTWHWSVDELILKPCFFNLFHRPKRFLLRHLWLESLQNMIERLDQSLGKLDRDSPTHSPLSKHLVM